MATNISNLIPKEENGGTSAAGKLSAEEFNRLVTAAIELQRDVADIKDKAVYGITQGSTTYRPVDNIVTLQGANAVVSIHTPDNTTSIIRTDGKAKVHLRFTSVQNSVDTAEIVNVQVQVYSVGDWETKGTIQASTQSATFDSDDSDSYNEYDISEFLTPGDNQVRFQAVGVETGVTGRLIFQSIVLTSLYLVNQQNYNTPIDAEAGVFPFSYQVYGIINKTLHVKISGLLQDMQQDFNLGTTQYTTTNFARTIADSAAYGILSHGVHTVTAWLTYEDSDGNVFSSDRLINRFMVINNQAATQSQRTQPYVMLQEVKSTIVNYVQTKLCGYAVFVPKINENGNIALDLEANVNLAFIISNYSDNAFEDPDLIEYLRIEDIVPTNTRRDLNVTVEIEQGSDSSEEPDTYDAYLHVWRMITNSDNEITGKVDILADSIGSGTLGITVDNSDSFSPTAGATFLINPKIRNNSETDYQRILNAKNNNAEITSTWTGFSGVNDGWILSTEDNQKVLRVLAGQRINIAYNPFAQYVTDPESSMTLEFDFKVRNVTDPEDSQVIGINETNLAGNMIGLRMNAMRAFLLTTSNQVEAQQDWQWQEDVRTHVSININHSVIAQEDATAMSLVRVFINGVINREFKFATDRYNEFCASALSNGGITIGSDSADIDIYSIRCYTNKQLSATNIVKNWISTLPTSEQKLKVRQDNAIVDEASGLISAELVRGQGKRVLIWHGTEPYQYLASKQKGYWEIFQYNADGTINPDCSGTICKASYLAYLNDPTVQCLEASRQGTTANTYYYSNLQTKIKDVTFEIQVALNRIHSSIVVTDNGDGTVALSGGNVSGNYTLNDDGESINVIDGWIDSNGMYRGNGYQVSPNVPLGQKMVNKINYASSMQSHLCGGVSSYNDLHTAVVGRNALQIESSKARVAKYTEPFFFFVQEGENSVPVYRGACTFGPGKMDDMTWGFSKSKFPHFAMIEGAENNYPLTDMRIPWDHKVLPHIKDGEIDGWGYPTSDDVNIDLDKAVTTTVDGVKAPTDAIMTTLQNAWNFLYWHNPRITYFNGTYDNFLAASNLDTTMSYWLTQGNDKYHLFRYDQSAGLWVNAGMWTGTAEEGSYAVRNLQTDPVTSGAINADNQGNYPALNSAFIAAIAAHAKQNIGNYFKVESLRFHYAYVNFFIAGTDNCSKNTYYVIVPATVNGVATDLIELHQDDLDTIFATDNTGRQTKPYYIDRQHPYAEGGSTTLYEGGANVLFNLCELMYEGTKELQNTMHSIFTAMCGLVSANDEIEGLTATQKTTPWGFLHKYFFSVQRYFPAVAWNEQARIRYEYPESQGFVSTGGRAVPPITQSLGNQLEAEKQYMKRRLVYAASYAAWGDFEYASTGSVGLDDVASSFGFQGYPNPDGTTASYTINVTPHQYIYPTANVGGNTRDPHVRLAPGQSYSFNLGTVDGDTGVAIFASNYYRSFGNVGNISCKADSTFTLQGKRLISFEAIPSVFFVDSSTGESIPAFRPQQFVIGNATRLKTISLSGCIGIKGAFNGSELIRAISINLGNTSISEVMLPASQNLISVTLPAKLTILDIDNVPSLQTLTLSGYNYLSTIKIGANIGTEVSAYTIISNVAANNAPVNRIILDSVNWNNVTVSVINWLLGVNDCKLTGVISVAEPASQSSSNITATLKSQIVAKWGNIDSELAEDYAGLLMLYHKILLSSITISGADFVSDNNTDSQYQLSVSPAAANNIVGIEWSVSDPELDGIVSINSQTGMLHVAQVSSDVDYITITVTIRVFVNDSYTTMTQTKSVGIFNRVASIGDYVYADGTFSSELDHNKTVVGICFYINPDDPSDRRMVAVENIQVSGNNIQTTWGLSRDDLPDIVLQDHPSYNVYDVPTLPNLETCGLKKKTGEAQDFINDNTYRDEQNGDALGFKIQTANTAAADMDYITLSPSTAIMGYTAGDKLPIGKLNTLRIIEHRNTILGDNGIHMSIPEDNEYETESQNLTACINTIVATGGSDTYAEYYYPAASYCYAYEPLVAHGEILADKFKAHNWYLPASGELSRLVWYHGQGYTEGVTNAIFAAAKVAGKFAQFASGTYQSSTERNVSGAWGINFVEESSGYYLSPYHAEKSRKRFIRPCASF